MFWFVYFIIIDLSVDTTVYIYMHRHLAMSLLNICHEIQWTFLPSTIASIDPCPLTCIITIGRICLVSSPLVGSDLYHHHWSDLSCVITIGRIWLVSSPLVGSVLCHHHWSDLTCVITIGRIWLDIRRLWLSIQKRRLLRVYASIETTHDI